MSQIINDCYAGNIIYGKTIKKSIGFIEVKIEITLKEIAIDDTKTDVIQNKIEEALKNLIETAKNNDGNAVINVRITNGSHTRVWGGGNNTNFNIDSNAKNYIIAYGDAVLVE